jgi:putative urate catabolism protein
MIEGPPRDLIGYGARPPHAAWPGGARLALNLVVNYEEGAEYCLLNGDPHSETILSDLSGLTPRRGGRELNIESAYEYGSRAGLWRILRLLEGRRLPYTVYAVGQALEQNPEAAAAIAAADCDVVSHAWRWIDYQEVPEEEERDHVRRCVAAIERLTGARPVGWYTGRPSLNTRRLVVEDGGFLYDCDAYNDDLPYWTLVAGKPHLVICHTLDNNDSRFSRAQGFDLAEEFFTYIRDGFDWLYAEGAEAPKMMTVAVHCRLIGRPGRIAGLARFLDHVQRHDDVWICQRQAIARHWIAQHPYSGAPGGAESH